MPELPPSEPPRLILSEDEILEETAHLARYIQRWAWEDFVLHRTSVTVVGLLSDGLFFHADLIRATDSPVRTGALLKHGADGTRSFTVCIDHTLRGQFVVIADVLCRGGPTMPLARQWAMDLGARKVKTVSLLYQPTAPKPEQPDIFARKARPDAQLSGYGLKGPSGWANTRELIDTAAVSVD